MFYHKIVYCIFIFSLALLGQSCENGSGTFVPATNRTILVYMLENNNPGRYAHQNISDMMSAISERKLNEGKTVTYLSDNEASSQLKHQARDTQGHAIKKMLKTYIYFKSANREYLLSVITDVKESLSSREYGLILWKHATGQESNAPRTTTESPVKQINNRVFPRPVGPTSSNESQNNYIKFTDVVSAIPDTAFSFIISGRISGDCPMAINRQGGLSIHIPGTGDYSLEDFRTALNWYKKTCPAENTTEYINNLKNK